MTLKNRVALCCILAVPGFLYAQAQVPPPEDPNQQQAAQPPPLLPPQELDNLVAPVALYPDPLLSQVLSASTYPLEVIEAQQWLQQNRNLQGEQLMQAARQQPWDASVQALVAFPDVLQTLSSNVRWTTDLGNAFLAQEADVMSAVQRMRSKARANGRLSTNQQQVVTEEPLDDGQAIVIQPANPEMIYVPYYDPAYVYGPPVWGYYPSVWYPSGFSFGFGFGRGIFMSSFFGGWGGWNAWGWGCNWRSHGLFLNTGFYNRYGFPGYYRGYGYRSFGAGRVSWAHNPSHRWGVPYPNRSIATRFHSDRFVGRGFAGDRYSRSAIAPSRSYGNSFQRSDQNWRRFNGNSGQSFAQQPGSRNSRQWGSQQQNFNGSQSRGYSNNSRSWGGDNNRRSFSAPQSQPSRGFSNNSRQWGGDRGSRSFSAPQMPRSNGGSFSAPRQQSQSRQSFSAPSRSSGGGGGGWHGRSGGSSGGGGGSHSRGGGGGGSHRR